VGEAHALRASICAFSLQLHFATYSNKHVMENEVLMENKLFDLRMLETSKST